MAGRWKKEVTQSSNNKVYIEYSRSSAIDNCAFENGATVEKRYSFNGSGDSCFGGNKFWPSIKAEVSIPTSLEHYSEELMTDLKMVIDNFMAKYKVMEKANEDKE